MSRGYWTNKGLKAKRILYLRRNKLLVFPNPFLIPASNPIHTDGVCRNGVNEKSTSLDVKDKNVEL